MAESSKEKREKSIHFWFTAIGVPFGVSLALCFGIGLKASIVIPLSALIALLVGMIAYTFILRGEIKDLKDKLKGKRRRKNVRKKK